MAEAAGDGYDSPEAAAAARRQIKQADDYERISESQECREGPSLPSQTSRKTSTVPSAK